MSRRFAENLWKNIKDVKAPSRADVGAFIFGFTGIVVFTDYVASYTHCVGPSMIPTFNPHGSVALIDKASYKIFGRPYQKDDVVICISPLNPERRVCKRIVAEPKEYIVVNNGGRKQLVQIPDGHVWLEGDNPSNSHDSRQYGPVPIGLIVGRVVSRTEDQNVFKWRFPPPRPRLEDDIHEVIDKEDRKIERFTKEKLQSDVASDESLVKIDVEHRTVTTQPADPSASPSTSKIEPSKESEEGK